MATNTNRVNAPMLSDPDYPAIMGYIGVIGVIFGVYCDNGRVWIYLMIRVWIDL